MDRSEFLKICGGACLGMIGMGALLQGCATGRMAEGTLQGNRFSFPKSAFEKKTKPGEPKRYFRHVIVQPGNLDYPVAVFRLEAQFYTALLLRCTHQGNQLEVSGDLLTCPAHGSEFDRNGEVMNGPAEQYLTSYPVHEDETMIHIQLA